MRPNLNNQQHHSDLRFCACQALRRGGRAAQATFWPRIRPKRRQAHVQAGFGMSVPLLSSAAAHHNIVVRARSSRETVDRSGHR